MPDKEMSSIRERWYILQR